MSLVLREFTTFEDIISSDAQDLIAGAAKYVKRLAASHGHAFFNGKHFALDDVCFTPSTSLQVNRIFKEKKKRRGSTERWYLCSFSQEQN